METSSFQIVTEKHLFQGYWNEVISLRFKMQS